MLFDPKDYISSSDECIVLSETVRPNYTKDVSFVLTNKKIILAGEEYLQILPLNKIIEIVYKSTFFEISCGATTNSVKLVCGDNPSFYNKIVQEITKRIG